MAFPPSIASLIALPFASPAGSPIDGTVVAAVLAAAALHALWNAIAHATDDQLIGFALIGAGHTACGAIIVAATGLPPRRAWIFIGTSVFLHIVYTLLLLASYRLGEFSQMYPVARGTSPWAVALVATTVLGQRLPPLQLTGVLVISGGLISLAALGHRPTAPASAPGAARKALAAAFGTGLVIACYTIVDGVGVHHAPVAAYAGWIFMLQGPAIPLLAAARYGRTLPARLRGPAAAGVTGGVLSVVAYGLVLWAQARGTLAPIAALRETSIVIGAVIGAVFLGERFGLRRAVAAAIVVTGIVLINVH